MRKRAVRNGSTPPTTSPWERWLHPSLAADPERRRIAVTVGGAAAFAFIVVLCQVSYALWQGHVTAALPGSLFLAVPLATAALLRVRPTPQPASRLLIASASVLISVAVSGEDGFHGATVAWYGVISAAAVLTLGEREGLAALAINVCAAALIETLKATQVITPWLFVSPALSLLRNVGLITGFMVLAVLFERTRREAAAQAERLSQSKSNFLANVSHELRTPMNGVLGMTELLLRSDLEEEQREQLALLQRSGRQMVVLLNDLLDMSKVEAGKMELDPVDFDLRQQLSDLHALHAPVAAARGLSLAFEHEGLAAVVRGDALRLRQVLDNLVTNALKFTAEGGVKVTARATTEGRYRFEVQDTGIGISPQVLPRLFSPFTQAEAGITRRFGGTGLGLVLCKELVTLMGGSITVESAEGRGTTVRVDVALPQSHAALADEPTAPVKPLDRATALPVLVVDDNPINLKVACGLVEKAGYRPLTARNGREALEVVQAQPLALVLMDCHMPVMDGYEATEQIRSLDSDVSLLPVIALTASAMPEELERCRRSGMNDCLVKPVSLEVLQRVLDQVAALHALQGR
jgi:signal transduction histidine kinase/CheY-like chemotaxis protein